MYFARKMLVPRLLWSCTRVSRTFQFYVTEIEPTDGFCDKLNIQIISQSRRISRKWPFSEKCPLLWRLVRLLTFLSELFHLMRCIPNISWLLLGRHNTHGSWAQLRLGFGSFSCNYLCFAFLKTWRPDAWNHEATFDRILKQHLKTMLL